MLLYSYNHVDDYTRLFYYIYVRYWSEDKLILKLLHDCVRNLTD